MPDYKSMYYHLLRAQLKAIGILENAQCETEEMAMNAKEPFSLDDVEAHSPSTEAD